MYIIYKGCIIIYSNNSDVNVLRFKLEVIIVNIVNAYPDIVIKMYSNNGRIVDADDEYLSTSEWRCMHKPVISNRTNPITDFC